MATVLSTLYPPLIGTFQPAFEYDDGPEISFTISNYNSYLNIQHLHISLVNQKTNQNALATNEKNAALVPAGTYLIDGIWIVPFQRDDSEEIFTHFDNENNLYKIKIPKTILKNSATNNPEFVIDYYYKVQLRFDCVTDSILSSTNITDIINTDKIFNSTYLNRYKSYFSEWSSISLLKAIPHTEIQLTNFSIVNTNGISNDNLKNKKIPQFTPGIVPIVGKLVFSKNNNIVNTAAAGKEWIKDYQIQIYQKEEDQSETLILDSNLIYPENYKFNNNNLNIGMANQSDYWSNNFTYFADLTDRSSDYIYILKVTIHTKNNYTAQESFNFRLINPLFTPTWEWKFNEKELSYYGATVKKIVTEEDGEITGEVRIVNANIMYRSEPGYMFIRRADSLSDFKNWTIIKCVGCRNPLEPVTFTDNTVGSLIGYKYSAQYLCFRGGIQTPVDKCSTIIYPDFHDILISSGDKQLAIRYNGQINSMTPVVNRTKIDTLGGRYPKFAENAKLKYKQFNLSGLLIAESDYNRKFLNDLDYSEEMYLYDNNQKGAYMVRNDTVPENFDSEHLYGTYTSDINKNETWIDQEKKSSQINTNHDLYPTNNWWWERKFREEAIEWLNNGEPKLYRSMTEGNMIVMIDGISLTPNNQLGRRTWNFSCTVYEIGDGYDLELLDNLNIYNIQNEYSKEKIKLDELIEEDEEESLIRQTITVLGQKYEINALKDNQGNYLDIVNNTIVNDINSWYQGVQKKYQYKLGTALLHNLKITFTSPPQYYKLDSNDISLSDVSEENLFLDQTNRLGYRLTLAYYSDGDSKEVPIFVESIDGRTGYYQVPSNLDISGITLYDDAIAILDYYLTYKIEYYNAEIADFYSQEETIVGQVSDYWSYRTNIGNYINEKYRVYNWKQDDDYEYAEGLFYWKGINIESDPYSIYQISYQEGINNVVNAEVPNNYIIPRTGVLNLSGDYKIASCYAMGRQMVIVDNERQPFLDEWECVLDDTVKNPPDIGSGVTSGVYWYLIKVSGDMNTLDKDNNDNYVLVQLYLDPDEDKVYIIHNGDTTDLEYGLDWDDFNIKCLEFYEDWIDLDEINEHIISNIVKPIPNTIYGLIDNNGIFYYMIYYLNRGWYPVSFIEESNGELAWAKVPISGTIEYKADIYKQGWEVRNNNRQSNLWGHGQPIFDNISDS